MKASDAILHADLVEAGGLGALAERAAAGEFNDYFGADAMPQHALIAALKGEVKLATPVRRRLIDNVVAGKYDGTKEEADEWARSPEGREAFRELQQRH